MTATTSINYSCQVLKVEKKAFDKSSSSKLPKTLHPEPKTLDRSPSFASSAELYCAVFMLSLGKCRPHRLAIIHEASGRAQLVLVT